MNPGWGYTKIRDALRGFKLEIARATIANILAEAGLEPAPERNEMLDPVDGFLQNGTHLMHDRDPLYTEAGTKLLESEGVKSVRLPASSPNCNPYAERFVRTARSECLDHFLIFGERHLKHLLGEFCVHYHGERFHQGLDGRLIRPAAAASNDNGTTDAIQCRSRLGGLLDFYHRQVAMLELVRDAGPAGRGK